jgi:hypothetical protein
MKYLFALTLIAIVSSCNETDTKDEAHNAKYQNIVVDAVAVDNDDTETTSRAGMAELPK